MAQKSGFFNALQTAEGYDRKYNANDYTDNLAVVISNGVLRSTNDDLKVTVSGMIATVAAGRAWINGHYYYNDAPYSFAATTAPIGGKRYDRIMLRLDTTVTTRNISLVYVQGTAASTPTKPAPVRTGNIYDLVLADIFVDTNATSVVTTDTRADANVCGWVFSTSGDNSFFTSLDNSFMTWFESKKDTLSSVTLFKRYQTLTTISTPTSQITFNIPQYDPDTCFIEVYVNGVFENRYTKNNNVLTFQNQLIAGTVVTVNCYKSIDGTGIQSVSQEITTLQNQVAALTGVNKFTYVCTGLNDNISLSQIAQAFYNGSYTVGSLSAAAEAFLSRIGGNTYLASMQSDAQAEIDVVGELYASTSFTGEGSSANPYKFFMIGNQTASNKKIVFNFAKCGKIYVAATNNASNVVFGGINLYIKNLKLVASSSGAGTSVVGAVGQSGSKYYFDDCDITIIASNYAIIANTGNFTNCKCTTKGATYSRCFDIATFGFVRLNGGTYYAYGTTGREPSIIYISSGSTAALCMAYNINTPIVSQTSYIQQYLANINAGKAIINGVVNYSLLKNGSGLTVTNEAVYNKAD